MGNKTKVEESVFKAFSPEEKTVLANIQSSISELLAMEGGQPGEGAPAPAPAETGKADMAPAGAPVDNRPKPKPIIKADDGDDDEDDKADKSKTSTASDGSTANSPADDQIEEPQGEEQEKTVNELAKAILVAMGNKGVRKSAPLNPMVSAISKLTSAVQKTIENQNELSNTVASLLQGMGVVKQLEIAQKSQNSVSTPVINANNEQTLGFLVDMIKQAQGNVNKSQTSNESPSTFVNKALSDRSILTALSVHNSHLTNSK